MLLRRSFHHLQARRIIVASASSISTSASSLTRFSSCAFTSASIQLLHTMSSTAAPSSSTSTSTSSTSSSGGGPMQQTIHTKLTGAFSPSHLTILNESHLHSGPRDAESHFKVTVVSEAFEGQSILARHRAVNAALATELKQQGGIHALSITARTPKQWEADQTVSKSPACMGGSKHDPQRA